MLTYLEYYQMVERGLNSYRKEVDEAITYTQQQIESINKKEQETQQSKISTENVTEKTTRNKSK